MTVLTRLAFHKNGRPRGWLSAVLSDRRGAIRPAFRRVVFKKSGKVRPRFAGWVAKGSSGAAASAQSAGDWLEMRWPALRPLTIFPDTTSPRRITVVTDSVGPSSLFGGVGTALILAALWAQRSGAALRIVTRTERPVTTALSAILGANGLSFTESVEFLHAPHFGSAEIAVGERDVFMATSWWTARSLLNTVPANRIVYLLQEDERMFYSYGDDHLACSATLAEPFAQVVVNSGLLHHHLTKGCDAVPGLAERAIWFEPAFTYTRRTGTTAVSGGKRKLFFYARPHNPRNLYATGVKLIEDAVLHAVLDSGKWEVHLVGKDVDPLVFNGGLQTVIHKPMTWNDYATFLQGMDAGLSLMYTPHPSYPPIDLAAMGVPVLTNKFGNKVDLHAYSNNILTAGLTASEMLDGFRRLIALAENPAACAANLVGDRINRDWAAALDQTVGQLASLTGRFD